MVVRTGERASLPLRMYHMYHGQGGGASFILRATYTEVPGQPMYLTFHQALVAVPSQTLVHSSLPITGRPWWYLSQKLYFSNTVHQVPYDHSTD